VEFTHGLTFFAFPHPSSKGFIMTFAKVLFHLFMTVITGGIWLIGLIIYAIVKK